MSVSHERPDWGGAIPDCSLAANSFNPSIQRVPRCSQFVSPGVLVSLLRAAKPKEITKHFID